MGCIPVKFHGIWSCETSQTSIFLLFSQYPPWGIQQKITYLPTSPNDKFKDHSHQNRFKQIRFVMLLQFPRNIFVFGGHFWKCKPPGGLPETRPWFLETRISLKSQGLKTVWSIDFFGCLSSWCKVPIQWHYLFDTVSNKIVPEFIVGSYQKTCDFVWTPWEC